MKKLTLSALSIAVVCFAACTKDNSKSTQPTVKINTVTSSSLAHKDTIQPQSAIKSRVATPSVVRDTIQPK